MLKTNVQAKIILNKVEFNVKSPTQEIEDHEVSIEGIG